MSKHNRNKSKEQVQNETVQEEVIVNTSEQSLEERTEQLAQVLTDEIHANGGELMPVTEPTEVPSEPVYVERTIEVVQEEEKDPFWVPDAVGQLAVQPSADQADVFIAKARTFVTQSARVRFLTSQGMTRGQIVKAYPGLYGRTILYQHVRNILVTPVKGQ